MDLLLLLKAALLGVVEGLTEFLPISSTGHLILASSLLGFHDAKGKVFELFIQTGAMFAILWEYRARFATVLLHAHKDEAARRFIANLCIAFVPLAALGLLLGSYIKATLFHAVPVAIAFIVGGFIILWVERRPRHVRIGDVGTMTWKDALLVGLAQAVALIPGMSRSGSTIIGGMLFGLSRRAATEFSFFLAIPTLIVAGAYDVYRHRALMTWDDAPLFGVGLVASFVSAFICVRWLIHYVAAHDFKPFAWYRIGFGGIVLLTAYTGWIDWSHA